MHTWALKIFYFCIKSRDLTSLSSTVTKHKTLGVRLAFKLVICRPMDICTLLPSINVEQEGL